MLPTQTIHRLSVNFDFFSLEKGKYQEKKSPPIKTGVIASLAYIILIHYFY